jgi:phosphatidylserine/phosphatidylglycerophosphate/cardiolipin synthase-like enzyme
LQAELHSARQNIPKQNRFVKFIKAQFSNSNYEAAIAHCKHLETCQLILQHHLNRLKANPCFQFNFDLNASNGSEGPSSVYALRELKRHADEDTVCELKRNVIRNDVEDEKLALIEFKEAKQSHAVRSRSYYTSQHGIPTALENVTNARASYPMRSGNMVKHYSNMSDNLEGTQGAFTDIMHCIQEAQHLILISGWLFEPQHHLPHKLSQPKSLGRILVEKAIANPKMEIAIMLWNQTPPPSNHRNALSYLREIALQLGQKDLPPNLQLRQVRRTGVFWSHHQKFVVCDGAVTKDSALRELVVFYGSSDLSAMKFDTDQHVILDTTENKKAVTAVFRRSEIYRPAVDYFNENTPRLPWREVMSQLRGPSTQDFLSEFTTRWVAANQGAFSSPRGSNDSGQRVLRLFLKIKKDNLFEAPSRRSKEEKHLPVWDMQVVRSGERTTHAGPWHLPKSYEKSIHKAYLQAIAQAEKFIYIETQFLTGVLQSKNRIPQALVNRIVEHHQAGNPFHVFIILPLIPNGNPGGKVNVEPLRKLQWETMQWMMHEIEQQTGEFWGQFLTFSFFGSWEGRHDLYVDKFHEKRKLGCLEWDKTSQPELVAYSGHATVYIHSKLMIVDDKFVINGSANLSERSLGGPNDTEIAVYQRPTAGYERACIRETRQFRLKIWKPYFGHALEDNVFDNPHLPENVRLIQNHAFNNLRLYMSAQTPCNAMTGHLLTWPFVMQPGNVGKMREGCEFLPDTLKKDIRDNTSIFRWFPPDDSTPAALAFATKIKHRGYH